VTKRVIGVVPARLESTRLSRKLLRPILGYPMLTWVYRRARQARCLDDLLVATDSEEILAYCRGNGIPAVMTSAAHRSGTDRIFEVMTQHTTSSPREGAIWVNIQGDEPMITPDHIDTLLKPFAEGADAEVSTLKVAMSLAEARDPNNVKVVTATDGRALYFSRALIPYDREETKGFGPATMMRSEQTNENGEAGLSAGLKPRSSSAYYKHLGLYAYTSEALRRFHELPPSPLEQREGLEQLRFLENGIPIVVLETGADTIGVDTEEDLAKVEEHFRRTGTRLP